MRLHWTDPILPKHCRYYHLVLLFVLLIRYLDYLITTTLPKTQSTGELVHDVLLGVFVVFFIPAWMYRVINHHLRKERAVYLTLFVELLLEIALVVYYVFGTGTTFLYFDKESRTFAQLVWHAVWLLQLSLIIYKLLPVFICLPFNCIKKRHDALFHSITGGMRPVVGTPDSGTVDTGTPVSEEHLNRSQKEARVSVEHDNRRLSAQSRGSAKSRHEESNVFHGDNTNFSNNAGSDRMRAEAASDTDSTSSGPDRHSQLSFVPMSATVSPHMRTQRAVDTSFAPATSLTSSSQ